jgi:hypothetical protein
MNTVQVYTAITRFGYEPAYEDGSVNVGDVKRATRIIHDEYPDTYEPAALIELLTNAEPGSVIDFPGGAELRAEQEAQVLAAEQAVAEREAAAALAAESPEDRKAREFHEATKAKLDAIGYRPSRF